MAVPVGRNLTQADAEFTWNFISTPERVALDGAAFPYDPQQCYNYLRLIQTAEGGIYGLAHWSPP